MERKTLRWESELWSYLSSGDGTNCPMFPSCQLRENNIKCFSENIGYFKLLTEFIDKDGLELTDHTGNKFELSTCPNSGRIFRLVSRLAFRYLDEAGIGCPPVSTSLITHTTDNIPIEIQQVPLKAYRGAVWRLKNCWVVHLNSNDSRARQRFILFHEIFHILAHSKATPVFKKTGCDREGSFNEMLADHFAAACLVPDKLLKKVWHRAKDVNKMAALFDAPRPVAWLALRMM